MAQREDSGHPPGWIPVDLERLTVDWWAATLSAAGVEATPSAVDVEPLGPGAGFLGDVSRLRLRYGTGTATGPASLIAKQPPSDPSARAVGAMLRVWEREHAFYTEIAPASLGAQVPMCVRSLADAGADSGEGRWLLLLEDCPSVPLDAGVGATREQAEAAVDALAAFHAHWWQSEQRYRWMPGFDGPGVGGLQGAWIGAIPVFLERYGHLLPAETDRWLSAFASRLPDWSERAGAEPLTIVHADYRLDNLRFHDGRMTIIDWQTALRG
ncbi:MAG: phosphotransferase, partial [Actinomycetota bacterium]